MSLIFERGSEQEPKGHAIVYFRAGGERILALYIVVLPVRMDITKYIPPLLAPQFGNIAPSEMAAVALPPVPEEVSGYQELERLSRMREDDLVLGGTLRSTAEPTSLLEAGNRAVQEYLELWKAYIERSPAITSDSDEEEGVDVSEVLYSFMGERDKLSDMAKLVGKLRFAVEGRDVAAIKEAEEELEVLGKYLPETYLLPRIVRVAKDPTRKGAQLAQLYLERCYKLVDGDEEGARLLEERIRAQESSE